MVNKDEIKWENILTPEEMFERFNCINYWIKKDGDVYINSNHFMSMLLKPVHEDTKDFDRIYRIVSRNIPYVYKRIVEEAKNERKYSTLEIVSERRLGSSSNL
ncbi:hypothetical protein A3K64_01565 [Candidatus Micrarchaeota archaeon RBG_16_36_9]|nr:MAG: hypothetical protein A3K64_01565 [Candidatus Micrarchaeota archaeon RBG_16_36_9]